MVKVFISQPMFEKTGDQIMNERINAFVSIKNAVPDAVLLDTFIREDLDENHPGLCYLSESIKKLDEADAVWMLKGWEKSRGCKIEHDCAVAYGIPTYYLY